MNSVPDERSCVEYLLGSARMSKEKTNPLKLVNEIVIGIYTQISGLEHELSTVVNMQQRSITVSTTGN
jgi:hypothetical protein